MAEADLATARHDDKHGLIFLRNILANAAGRGWSMLMNFAFVPIYIKLLGIEAYGVIAFFATLSALFSFLDLGLSSTLNREIARRTGTDDVDGSSQDVVRTLETVYWGIGLSVSAIIVIAAPFIASHWLKASGISHQTLTDAIRLMGLVISLHWPSGLYAGGFAGLQKQVLANTLDVVFSTCRGIGAIAVLYAVSTSVEGFFVWQALISGATVITLRTLLLRQFAAQEHPAHFNMDVLRETWRFAGGMTLVSIVSIVMMYADKVVISVMLPLKVYAQYMLANTLAAASAAFAFAVFGALYPRLTQLVAARGRDALQEAYHLGTQVICLAVFPPAAIVMFFSKELILFWTWDQAIASFAAPLAGILVVGTAINAAMMAPYALQLANGSTKLAIIGNSVAIVFLLPGAYVLTQIFGVTGAAFLWPAQNLGYMLILAPIVHRRFLPEVTQWRYFGDLAVPFAVAVAVAGAGRLLVPHDMAPIPGFLLAGVTGAFTLVAVALTTNRGRQLAASLSARARLRAA